VFACQKPQAVYSKLCLATADAENVASAVFSEQRIRDGLDKKIAVVERQAGGNAADNWGAGWQSDIRDLCTEEEKSLLWLGLLPEKRLFTCLRVPSPAS
jgi:hypothetical protein